MFSRSRKVASLVLALGLFTVTGGSAMTALAATTPAKPAVKTTEERKTENISQSITHSYSADATIQLGMIVKVNATKTSFIEPVTEATLKSMLGVVVKPNETTITISPQNSVNQQVYVASTGKYLTLVSNQTGPIKPGDYITVSALAGIGMKADEGQSLVLGKAVGGFSGTNNVVGKVTLKDQKGKSTDVSISRIIVDLDISHNPLENKSSDKVPGVLNKAAVTISGKPVSAARIYLGLVVLAVSGYVASTVVYSGVRSGMISVGRNPLSKKSIIKSLIQTVVGGLIIFVAGIFGVYAILKL